MNENNSPRKRRSRVSTVVGRMFLVFFTIIFVLLFSLVALCHTLLTGPSVTMRDRVVLSAMQASATKWLPGLFLDDELVEEICTRSADVQEEVISMGAFVGSSGEKSNTSDLTDTSDDAFVDEWANAVDGMIYKTYSGSSFKA